MYFVAFCKLFPAFYRLLAYIRCKYFFVIFIVKMLNFLTNLSLYFRMALPHLLDPYYDQNRRGRLTAEGQVMTYSRFVNHITFLIATNFVNQNFNFAQELPLLRPRTHNGFVDMRYDDRYTPLLRMAGLDVVSYQVRRGLPVLNPAAITALVDR